MFYLSSIQSYIRLCVEVHQRRNRVTPPIPLAHFIRLPPLQGGQGEDAKLSTNTHDKTLYCVQRQAGRTRSLYRIA